MAVNVTLVDKDGNEWLAGSATEVNDLLAQGYRFKGQGTAGVADQPVAQPAAPKPAATPAPAPAAAPATTDGGAAK